MNRFKLTSQFQWHRHLMNNFMQVLTGNAFKLSLAKIKLGKITHMNNINKLYLKQLILYTNIKPR